MKIPVLPTTLIQRAKNGDIEALDALLHGIQPGVFNLAVRMLGNREDARDATQEILLKVTTHLATFRGEAAFNTWVYQVARNHLLSASTRSREPPEVSLENLGEHLRAGLELGHSTWQDRVLTPEEKASSREMAVACTQGMLMRLDREHRLAYVLDVAFGLPSAQAAEVLGIGAAAYRKRLSRARQALQGVSSSVCGMVNAQASCRCEKQVHAVTLHSAAGGVRPGLTMSLERAEREAASQALDEVMALGDIAEVMRSHPDYQAPSALAAGIRAVLVSYGQVNQDRLN
ncbi:MAG TPA: RNA polymerase sigma factor [Polaromonas sp.]|uniref:RNA polymerase sigma factor n=1 Tax=Polaromonas sp. TaxID=1869339 RepID=UPI002D7644C1|nr:RNA polymerase sigma factor [Polaromonas sp.]HYW57110.1 RNA polymerase sigma factor [Polaromonas sp.]